MSADAKLLFNFQAQSDGSIVFVIGFSGSIAADEVHALNESILSKCRARLRDESRNLQLDELISHSTTELIDAFCQAVALSKRLNP